MAITADSVIVELEARIDKYRRDMRAAADTTDDFQKRGSRNVKKLENDIRQSSGQISGTLKGLAASFATAFSVRELGQVADSFTRLQNNLRVAGLEGQALANVQSDLLGLSQQYGVSVEGLSSLYSKASDAALSFGGSQEDIKGIVEGVSQSLLITGTSAGQAQGALLGLSQALASGTVRAEEFNQINEGGLRPLLQAAAASERFGGDINKLRAAVVDGKLSSKEFFDSISANADLLAGRASNATLTLAGGLEALASSFTVYIGEADKSLGVSAAIGEALKTLADNLDSVATAIAVVATAIGTKYVIAAGSAAVSNVALAASATGAAAQMGVLGSVAFAAQAALGGAATATEALSFAMAGLSKALPIIAISALAAGLVYLAITTDNAVTASKDYTDQLDFAKKQTERTANAMDTLASATGRAREESIANARALREETVQLLANAKAALQAAIAKKQAVIAENNERIRQSTRSIAGAGGGSDPTLGAIRQAERSRQEAQANVFAAVETVGEFNKQLFALDQTINSAPRVNTPAAPDQKKKGRTGKSDAEKAAEKAAREAERLEKQRLRAERQAASEERRLQGEILQSRINLTKDADEREALEREFLNLERDERIAQIQNDENFTDAQKDAQLRYIDRLYGIPSSPGEIVTGSLLQQGITQDRNERDAQLSQDATRLRADTLRDLASIADTTGERNLLEQQALGLEQELQRDLLRQQIANGQIADADEAQAQLATQQSVARERLRRSQLSPGGRFVEDLQYTSDNINDAVEGIQIDGLQSLNSELADAITGAKSLGEAFTNVADQIINDLIRIAIQQAIIKPLAGALFGGDSGGGLFAGLFGGGRASGGNVAGGTAYLVGENGPELFAPAGSGKIYPTGSLAMAGGNQSRIVQPIIQVDARGAVMNDQFASMILAKANDYSRKASAQAGKQAYMQSPERFGKLQSLGT